MQSRLSVLDVVDLRKHAFMVLYDGNFLQEGELSVQQNAGIKSEFFSSINRMNVLENKTLNIDNLI